MAPLEQIAAEVLAATRDARAAAMLIHGAERKRKSNPADPNNSATKSYQFSKACTHFASNDANRHPEYLEKMGEFYFRLEGDEATQEDAAKIATLIDAPLIEQYRAHRDGRKVIKLSTRELQAEFKAILPCDPILYEFRSMTDGVHDDDKALGPRRKKAHHEDPQRVLLELLLEIFRHLSEDLVPEDRQALMAAVAHIRSCMELRDAHKGDEHQKERRDMAVRGVKTQQDLDDLIAYAYILIRWATGRRGTEILGPIEAHGWELVEGYPYLMRCRLAKGFGPLETRRKHLFPTLIPAARVKELLEFIHSEPTARVCRDGTFKTLAQKHLNNTAAGFTEERITALFKNMPLNREGHARLRGFYAHMAYRARETNRFHAFEQDPENVKDWTIDHFLQRALGHQSADTTHSYKDIIIEE